MGYESPRIRLTGRSTRRAGSWHTGQAHHDFGIDYLHQLQWPAMVVTVLAAWLIAYETKSKRMVGFWLFLLSNVLWVIWVSR